MAFEGSSLGHENHNWASIRRSSVTRVAAGALRVFGKTKKCPSRSSLAETGTGETNRLQQSGEVVEELQHEHSGRIEVIPVS